MRKFVLDPPDRGRPRPRFRCSAADDAAAVKLLVGRSADASTSARRSRASR